MSNRWRRGLSTEMRYWRRHYFAGHGRADLEKRLDPTLPLQEYVRRWLEPASPSASILDVGAGPLTTLGKVWNAHRLDITAVDVQADSYNRILADFGIVPIVQTEACRTEELVARFGRNRFDLVHVENALDHHANVLDAIEQMLGVVKVGGYVVMRHARNEAEVMGYRGLHQWNLCIEEDDYVIWNREARTSVRKEFGAWATLVDLEHVGGLWELAVIKKEMDAEDPRIE